MLVKVRPIADMLGISDWLVYDLTRQNKIPGVVRLSARSIRFNKEVVQRWIDAGCPDITSNQKHTCQDACPKCLVLTFPRLATDIAESNSISCEYECKTCQHSWNTWWDKSRCDQSHFASPALLPSRVKT